MFPADLFLLSGDAIVNESMLTGESVPVSKVPIKDEDLARWKDSKDPSGETTKSFLYAGTRVVRIRGSMSADGSTSLPALGLVVRTGTLPPYSRPCNRLNVAQASTPRRVLLFDRCCSQSLSDSNSTGILSASSWSLQGWQDWVSAPVQCNSSDLGYVNSWLRSARRSSSLL